MKRLRLAIFLIIISITTLHAQGLKYTTRAKAAILYNPDNGVILFQKDPHKAYPPASTLKIATAIYALEQKKIDPKKPCLASKNAAAVINAEIKQADFKAYPAYILEHDAVMVGIKAGKSYSFETLLYGMLLESGNDAANVFAEACSGSIEKFMEELNGYLLSKGIANTHFYNPHGLHHPEQVTTAYDIAQIATLAFNNPAFAKIIKSISFEGDISIKNTNRLLREGKYQYPKILGGKTGYVASVGYNLVAAAEDNGRRLILVLLGCKKSGDRFEEALALFEAAFEEKKKDRCLFSKDHECFVRKIPKAKGLLRGRLDRDVTISYFPSEERELKARLVWNNLQLPIAAGTEVGKLVVEDLKGNCFTEAPLFSEGRLKKSFFYQILGFTKLTVLWAIPLLALAFGVKLLKKRSKVSKR